MCLKILDEGEVNEIYKKKPVKNPRAVRMEEACLCWESWQNKERERSDKGNKSMDTLLDNIDK